jgi:hypothetical protein
MSPAPPLGLSCSPISRGQVARSAGLLGTGMIVAATPERAPDGIEPHRRITARPLLCPFPATRSPPPSRTLRHPSSLGRPSAAAINAAGWLQQTSCQASQRRQSSPKGVSRLKAGMKSRTLRLEEPPRNRGTRRGDEGAPTFLSTWLAAAAAMRHGAELRSG